jgi:phenylacetate-CoA ligase
MSDYEALRQRHVARAVTLAPRLIEQLDWRAGRLAEHRARKLRDLVRTSAEHSPWYRQRLADVDIDRLDETTLPGLPVLTKTELMEHFDDIVTDGRLSLAGLEQHLRTVEKGSYLFGRYTAITSGGSTGQRGVFVYDWDSWAVYWLSLFRGLLRAKMADPMLAERPAVLATVAAAHFSHATAAMARTFSGAHLSSIRFPVTLPTDQVVAGLNEAQPDFLLAYPSALHCLAREAMTGQLRIAPRRILAGAEPLLPEIRAAAEQAWDVKVINIWGTSEGGGTGVGCDQGGTHISDDQLIVEPVDLAGQPVAPGERSAKVYLTNLYNPVLPLIRYEITDEVTVLPGPCPCGSAHRRIADVQGRLDDVFVYQGRRVHPHLFRSELGREAGVVEYQVRQTPAGAAIAVRCTAPVSLDGLRDRVAAALARSGLERPQVTVEIVDRLERPGGPAKLRRFIPLAAGADASRQASPAPQPAGAGR